MLFEKVGLFDIDWKFGIGIGILLLDRGERDRISGSVIEFFLVNDCYNIYFSVFFGMEVKFFLN